MTTNEGACVPTQVAARPLGAVGYPRVLRTLSGFVLIVAISVLFQFLYFVMITELPRRSGSTGNSALEQAGATPMQMAEEGAPRK